MNDQRHTLVVGAHVGDFIWRAAGAIASKTARGETVKVVCLSYGERGESGELWGQPGQTIENVKNIRHQEASAAAEVLGAGFECLDLGDYPLEINAEVIQKLVEIFIKEKPDVVMTHTAIDLFNPDHPATYRAVEQARMLASGAGVASGFDQIRPPEFFTFEPHQPELCGFMPNTFVDITSAFGKKKEAMALLTAQAYLVQYYQELAERRANHARRISGKKEVRYAEAFQRIIPHVTDRL